MKKIFVVCCLLFAVCAIGACSKPDPILPGARESIFTNSELKIANKEITNLPDLQSPISNIQPCTYTQDSQNTIWDGDKKIYSGFAIANSVIRKHNPVCDGGFVYAGLSTGELVKINPRTRNAVWTADIYRTSNMTGGARITDIVAPAVIDGGYVYVGGLGDAFCKLRNSNGAKVWCLNIGVVSPFILVGNYAFVNATNHNLYAINVSNGEIYWRAKTDSNAAPKYENQTIIVNREKFDVKTGKIVD